MPANFPVVQNPADLSAALANSKIQEKSSAGGASFLKMHYRTGEWTLGAADVIVTGEEVLINTSSLQHGWILWSGNRPQKLLVSFTTPLPDEMESIVLPNGDVDRPKEGRAFLGAMYDDGEMLSFEGNSHGVVSGVDLLFGQIRAHSAEGSKYLFPLVTLDSERYHSTKVMKDAAGDQWVYNCVFNIVSWCNQDGEKEGEPAPVVEDQTAQATEPAPSPSTETEPPANQPKRRQRRQRSQPTT